uniref:ABC transporter domain-containing protein n=1 Tax=Panagrolaimus sp. PS1159 TaxID=55785 RepID=A0AC35GEU3_9BILA
MGKQKFSERTKFWKKQKFETSRREVLHQISGVAEPGEILAIIDASGAGKATLLNVLTQRNQKSLEVSGDVTIGQRQEKSISLGEKKRLSFGC